MDFKKAVTGTAGALASVLGVGKQGPSEEQSMIARMLADTQTGEGPKPERKPFSLPSLDDSLNEAAMKRKAAAEAAGEMFQPGEADYNDSGPYGYLHKKQIHDALTEYQQELEANAPHVDYQGILKQKLSDLQQMPEEHRTNPLTLFAMAMGDPEHARELIQTHNREEQDANDKQTKRWQELLDLKQQALEGSVKQALAEGDQRKIISGKWLDELAKIEQDKAKLSGDLKVSGEKNAAAERRAVLRGQWALKAVEARSAAMAQSVGLKTDSAEYRTLQTNARALAERLIKSGAEPEDAYDQAEEWVQNQLEMRGSAPASAGAGAGAPAPAGAVNPLQARINANRAKNTQTPQ